YVAGRRPDPSRLAPLASIIYSTILGAGTPTPPLPADRFGDVGPREEAKRVFEADPHVRVLMENGAGSPVPGLPAATFRLALRQWPARAVRPPAWYAGPGRTLARPRPRGCRSSTTPQSSWATACRPEARAAGRGPGPTGGGWSCTSRGAPRRYSRGSHTPIARSCARWRRRSAGRSTPSSRPPPPRG